MTDPPSESTELPSGPTDAPVDATDPPDGEPGQPADAAVPPTGPDDLAVVEVVPLGEVPGPAGPGAGDAVPVDPRTSILDGGTVGMTPAAAPGGWREFSVPTFNHVETDGAVLRVGGTMLLLHEAWGERYVNGSWVAESRLPLKRPVGLNGAVSWEFVPQAADAGLYRIRTSVGGDRHVSDYTFEVRMKLLRPDITMKSINVSVDQGTKVTMTVDTENFYNRADPRTLNYVQFQVRQLPAGEYRNVGARVVAFTVDGTAKMELDTTGQTGVLMYRAVVTREASVRNEYIQEQPAAVSETRTVSVRSKPLVTSQPWTATVKAGEAGEFVAVAMAVPSLTAIRWEQKVPGTQSWVRATTGISTAVVDGAVTTATYSLSGVTHALGDFEYRAVFVNELGETESNSARLLVGNIRIIKQPADANLQEGSRVEFVSSFNALSIRGVQWYWRAGETGDWVEMTGERASSLIIPQVDMSMHGRSYQAVYTGTDGQWAPTREARLSVIPNQPVIVSNTPEDVSVVEGKSPVFTVELVPGTPSASIQWQYATENTPAGEPKWTALGASGPTMTYHRATLAMTGYRFRAVVLNGDASSGIKEAVSRTATLTVTPIPTPPTVVADPESARIAEGWGHTFRSSYGAGAGSQVFVTWQAAEPGTDDWQAITATMPVPVPGTEATLELSAEETPLEANGRKYRAVFSNDKGSAQTEAALLTVVHTPPSSTVTITPRVRWVEQFSSP